jgi:DNA repair ATPase RecN
MFGVGMLALTLFYPDLWKNSESAKELRELWTAVPHFKTLIVQQEGLRKGKQSELKSIREEIASMDERQKIRGLPTSEMLEADLAADDEQLKPEDERSGLQALLHRQRVNVRYTKQMEDKIKSLRESIHETFIEIADHFQLFQADVDRFSVPDEDREVKNRQLFELIRNAVRINVRERSDLEPFCSQFPSAFIQGS